MSNAVHILSTISAFLDTCPDIPETVPIVIGDTESGPRAGTLVQLVTIGGEHYLVTVERITELPRH